MHTQNNLNNHMQQPTPFERHLNEYISMAIEIWPTMRTSLQHLSEVGSPRSDSFLPQRDYASMNSNDFMATISHDLTVFISSHDVRQ